MSNNNQQQPPPPAFLPGVRTQQPSPTRQPVTTRYVAPAMDRGIEPGDLQAMLMQRLAASAGVPANLLGVVKTHQQSGATLFPGYSVYRCVDEDHKLMREVAKTDQLGNTDQFIIAEQAVQALVLDANLTIVDLGSPEHSSRKTVGMVPIKTPPMSNMGTLYVEEAAVNRSSGRSLSGQPRRAGNLLID